MGWEGVKFPGKKCYEDVLLTLRGGWVSFSRKKRYVTLEWSLNNTTQVTLGMNHICFISLSITHIDDNIMKK